jgi:hypothetical protein
MKRFLILSLSLLLAVSLFAQKSTSKKKMKAKKEAIKGTWTKTASLYGGLTQVGNNNWYTTGSDKFTMSAMASLSASATNKWKNKEWLSWFDGVYGVLNTTKAGITKLNDRLELGTRYLVTPKQWKKWSYGSRLQLRTQFSDGYFYNYLGEQGVKRRRSGFFSPAYVTTSFLGLNYRPCKDLNVFMSPLTARWTIVTNQPYSYLAQGGIYKGIVEDPLARLYNVSPSKQHRGDFGLLAVASLKCDLMKNISYKGRVEMFGNYVSSYKDAAPNRFINMDWFITNEVSFNVNKLVKVKYNLDVMYDDDIKQPNSKGINNLSHSVGLQMLSTLGVGVSFKK